MQRVFDTISRVAAAPCNILVTGESGTGKDLVAQAIHQHSPRKNEKFVTINCGSIPEGLLESELFGHVKGAFSGAVSDKEGLVQTANGGTLFLDEIGDMSMLLQVKLLRLIQNKQVQKVGSTRQETVDVRIIVATNQNLPEKIAENTFRRDLYYRVNVVEICLPPLRDRGSDVSLLTSRFVKHYSDMLDKNIKMVSPEVMNLFARYPWPGNVRELENAVERAVTLCAGDVIQFEDIAQSILSYIDEKAQSKGNLHQRVANLELNCIKASLQVNGHDLALTAEDLGISLATLYRKLKKFNFPLARKIVSFEPRQKRPSPKARTRQ
jgi:transcriptional regulator with PAS, ATPase and Fis domain